MYPENITEEANIIIEILVLDNFFNDFNIILDNSINDIICEYLISKSIKNIDLNDIVSNDNLLNELLLKIIINSNNI